MKLDQCKPIFFFYQNFQIIGKVKLNYCREISPSV